MEKNEITNASLPVKMHSDKPSEVMPGFVERMAGDDLRKAILALGHVQDADWTFPLLDQYRDDFMATHKDLGRLTREHPGQRADRFALLWVYVADLFSGLRDPELPWTSLSNLRDGLESVNGHVIRNSLEEIEDAVRGGSRARPSQFQYMQELDVYAREQRIGFGTFWDTTLKNMEEGILVMGEEKESMCAWCISNLPDEN